MFCNEDSQFLLINVEVYCCFKVVFVRKEYFALLLCFHFTQGGDIKVTWSYYPQDSEDPDS